EVEVRRDMNRGDGSEQCQRKHKPVRRESAHHCPTTNRLARSSTLKNISPPSSATAANHASNYLQEYPASAARPSHSKSPRVSHSGPDTYPNRQCPARSAPCGSSAKSDHHIRSANSPAGS